MTRVVRGPIPAHVWGLIASETLLLFGCFLLASYWVVSETEFFDLYLLYDGGLLQIALVVAIIQSGIYLQLLYETVWPRVRTLFLQQLCMVLGFAFLAQALLGYTGWMVQLPKWSMVYGSLLVLLLLPLWRFAYGTLILTIPVRRLLFLGYTDSVREIVTVLSVRPTLTVIGYLSSDLPDTPLIPRLGSIGDVAAVVHEHRPDRIVTALTGASGLDHVRRQLLDLYLSGAQVEEAVDLYETVTGRVSIRDVQPAKFIFSTVLDPRMSSFTFHNFYSLLLGIVLLVVTLPILALAALLIRCFSSGPILERRRMVGERGITFVQYRFRVTSVEKAGELTSVGRWLRRWHIEGLPQLFNIVRGDMSFIGPRPESLDFAAILGMQIPFYHQRHRIRPGITGWEQINTEDQADSLIKLEYDLYYIKNMSMALDFYIFLHSFSPVRSPGAEPEANH